MAVERKIVIGLEDIQEVRLKCESAGCNERVALVTSQGQISTMCRHGHHWTIADQSLTTLLHALAQPQIMHEKTKKLGFSILLEFNEPVG